MKNVLKLTLLLGLVLSFHTAFAADCCLITAKKIGTNGFVIKCPGQYCLAEDVVYNPSGTNPAITISAQAKGNVTLDLNGKTLSQASKSTSGIDGVFIQPGLTNIIVKNGTIRDFSDAGIRAGAIPLSQLVTELDITNIRAFNNGSTSVVVDPNFAGEGMGGVVILNAQDVDVTDCVLNENIFTGLRGFNIIKFTMEDCHCDDTTAANWFAVGASVAVGAELDGVLSDIAIHESTFNRTSSQGITTALGIGNLLPSHINNVLVDDCQGYDTTTTLNDPLVATVLNFAYVSGIEVDVANNVTINNCEVSDNAVTINTPMSTGNLVFCTGIVINRDTNVSITNCEVTELKTTLDAPLVFPSGGTNANVLGLVGNHVNNAVISNCLLSNQTFINNSGAGVSLANQGLSIFVGEDVNISNTKSYNNVTEDPNGSSQLITEGFDLSAVGNAVLEDCLSNGHRQAATSPSGSFSIVSGFNAHAFECGTNLTCGPVVFRRCVATKNIDVGGSNGLAFGFTTREPLSPTLSGFNGPYVFDACIAENNTTTTGTGAGFDLFNLVNSKIINCLADDNNIGIQVTDFAPFASNNNILSENTVSVNTNFGFLDLSAGQSNAYYTNRAKNNGPNPVTTNYSGAIFPPAFCPGACAPPGANKTPILFWHLPNAPCPVNTNCVLSTPLDNISIIN